jgi:hypothetical protein
MSQRPVPCEPAGSPPPLSLPTLAGHGRSVAAGAGYPRKASRPHVIGLETDYRAAVAYLLSSRLEPRASSRALRRILSRVDLAC